jgi:hypothetical protein
MRRLVLLLAILSLLAVPAVADEPIEDLAEEDAEEGVELRTEEAFFLCEGETPVQDVDDLEGRPATWGPDAPTQSVAEGAGCGSADSPFMQQTEGNLYDASWQGTYIGAIDSLTLHLHNIYVGPARLGDDFQLKVRLFVNGRALGGEDGLDVAVTPVRSETGASELIEVTVEGIGLTSETDETRRQRIGIVVHGGTPRVTGPTVTDTTSAWVWGTTEVPAGLTFNPTEPAEAVIGG